MVTNPQSSSAKSPIAQSLIAKPLTIPATTVWSMIVGITSTDPSTYLSTAPSADDDAQALHEWLTQKADVSADRALLLTRRSPPFYQRSTQPVRSTLSYWMGQLRTHGIRTGDTLWFFWSGPGLCWDGDDYVLPLDAEPSRPLLNGIKVRSLFNALKSLPTDRIVVFLDIQAQPEAAQPEAAERWGSQTQQLAQQLGITTVLLTQTEENRSPARLGQGLFTAALLDTFRSHSTHQGLPEFLQRFRNHLPSLQDAPSDPSDRPMLQIVAQTETALIPIPRSQLSDCLTTGDLRRYARPPVMSPIAAIPVCPPNHVPPKLGVRGPSSIKISPPKPSSIEFRLVMLTGLLSVFSLGLLSVWSARSLSSRTYAQQMVPPPPISKPSPSPKPNPKNPPDRTLAALPVPEEPAGDSNRILEEARNYITPTDPDELLRAIDRVSQIPPGDPGYSRAQKQIDRWSENLYRLSQRQANQGNWRTAIAIAGQVRRDRSALYSAAQKSIREWKQRSKS